MRTSTVTLDERKNYNGYILLQGCDPKSPLLPAGKRVQWSVSATPIGQMVVKCLTAPSAPGE